MRHFHRSGFTVIELIVVLVIAATIAALAVPGMRGWIARHRVHGALNRVVAEIHNARMLAVESGGSTQLVLRSGPDGCVAQIAVVAGEEQRTASAAVVLPGLCMRSSGDSILTFNSRGMLRPPARSIRVNYGSRADSVVLSVSGRVRRTY